MNAMTETTEIMEVTEIFEIVTIAMINREVLGTQKIEMKNFKIGNEKKRKKESLYDMIKQKSVKKR